MQQGKIKKIVTERGFGFIELDEGKDVFFHCSGVPGGKFGDLEEGDKVNFEVEQSQRGPRAIKVQKIK